MHFSDIDYWGLCIANCLATIQSNVFFGVWLSGRTSFCLGGKYMLSSQAFTSNGIYVVLIYAIMLLPTIVIRYVANWKIFQKMGEPGWKALIPFYGPYILFKRVWD